uniref:Uncharacterized protein n=1 Tax=Strombidium inclinatum TaxID=197538 RepID=A0A7S3MT57_9SPIT|mmetsp:Transcript_17287/g.26671  ORF Transcript_17287/g.26671 Transcript_17287/m.26671 type:complete len:100 (+) Transcript_17287:839-1138(+)
MGAQPLNGGFSALLDRWVLSISPGVLDSCCSILLRIFLKVGMYCIEIRLPLDLKALSQPRMLWTDLQVPDPVIIAPEAWLLFDRKALGDLVVLKGAFHA